ncbi:unnamed protein product [Phyllotreta striolata]|uniref:Succinate dehydrogenase assembly factor 4, mitochondrial n=1 Tax=Phyllotreta striolata TaxID=444603 RepID=A0A9N9XRP8_PHYSR|nr:unnamed protein product [Phyllotreta striolata]
MSILMYMLRRMVYSPFSPVQTLGKERVIWLSSSNEGNKISARMEEFKKKLRAKTSIDKLEELEKHPHEEEEPLTPFPNNTNPVTGEIGGPRGPEPTRYGDWERKGRVTDF